MNLKQQEDKIKWFCLRTGSSEEEATRFLKQTKWKIDNAIQMRQLHYQELNNL